MALQIDNKDVSKIEIDGKEIKSFQIDGKDFEFTSDQPQSGDAANSNEIISIDIINNKITGTVPTSMSKAVPLPSNYTRKKYSDATKVIYADQYLWCTSNKYLLGRWFSGSFFIILWGFNRENFSPFQLSYGPASGYPTNPIKSFSGLSSYPENEIWYIELRGKVNSQKNDYKSISLLMNDQKFPIPPIDTAITFGMEIENDITPETYLYDGDTIKIVWGPNIAAVGGPGHNGGKPTITKVGTWK